MATQDNQYLNVDFGFRRGSKENLVNTAIKNGTLNFTKDTKELFVDIDDKRIQISSIIFNGGTEDQIRAIENPSNKLYLASDTFKLLYFDPNSLEWRVVTGDGIDLDRYYTKTQVNSLLDDITAKLEEIRQAITALQATHEEDVTEINEDIDELTDDITYIENNYLQANLGDETAIVDGGDVTDGETSEDISSEESTSDETVVEDGGDVS